MGPIEYYSFERVLKELQIEEEELKRLVSEGEIRAFRDEDKMKFKKSDIEGLKKGRMTEPTIILPSGEGEESSEDSEVLLVEEDTSETLLDIDDVAESSSTSVPTVDFNSAEVPEMQDSAASSDELHAPSSAELEAPAPAMAAKSAAKAPAKSPAKAKSEPKSEAPTGTITDELTFEEDSGAYVLESSDDVLIDSSQELVPVEDSGSTGADTYIDSDTGLQTEPLEMDSDSDAIKKPTTVRVDSSDEGGVTAPIQREGRGTHTHIGVPMAIEEPISSGMMLCLVATTVLLLFSGVIAVNIVQEVDTPVTGWLTDIMAQIVPAKNMPEKSVEKHIEWRSKVREGSAKRSTE